MKWTLSAAVKSGFCIEKQFYIYSWMESLSLALLCVGSFSALIVRVNNSL